MSEEFEMYSLKVTLEDCFLKENPYSFVVDMPSNMSLYDLHEAIQKATGFEDDHLFAFYHGKKLWDKNQDFGDYEDPYSTQDIALEKAFPVPRGKKLFYHFDFGDDWLFSIKKLNSKVEFNKRKKYPSINDETGKKPVQYN